MTSFIDFLNEQLNDPEFKAEYDVLKPVFEKIQARIDADKRFGITSEEYEAYCPGSVNDIDT